MIFQPDIETVDRPGLARLQSTRLAALARYVHDRVPFYRRRFEDAGVDPAGIHGVEDLPRLPFTHKSDLRDNYPFGLLAVPMEEVLRVHASSGTTGKPTVVAYTRRDVEVFSEVCARSLACAGAEPGMLLHNAYGYGLFTGGLGLHYGGERLGMAVVPVSGGMTERQITLIRDFRPQVIACTPSYALTLGQAFAERGVSPQETSLKYAVVGAEPWTEFMRAETDAALGVTTTNIYGLSEIIGPGVSNECVETRLGSHVMEDHFLPEVVDPESGEHVPDGEEGVLVLTTLTKEAMPLIRYWTGDLTSLTHEVCGCGRTFARMSLIKGRTDDMLIVRGINVYPTQVEEVLGRVPELSPHYKLIVTRERNLDEVEVQVEVSEALSPRMEADSNGTGPAIEADARLLERVETLIKESIGCGMRVSLMAPGALPRSEGGKLKRVEDRRSLD